MSVKLMNWIGGKIRMIDELNSLIPEHVEYYELFAGSCAIFLNKYTSSYEVLNDGDFGMATLYRVLADEDKREIFYEKFINIEVSKNIFEMFKNECDSGFVHTKENDIDVAVIAYYITVYSFSAGRRGIRYHDDEVMWEDMRSKVLENLDKNWDEIISRLENTIILNSDAMDMLEIIKNRKHAYVVLDPPYVSELMGGCKDLYNVKFGTDKQKEMLELIQDAKAKILLCGYRGGSYLYDQYLNAESGWHCYCIQDRLTSPRKRDDGTLTEEYVWINYEVPLMAQYKIDTTDYAFDKSDLLKLQKYQSA